jgi:hypothetical protein
MDGHPQATVVLISCLLVGGCKEATTGITLFNFIFFLFQGVQQEGEYCINLSQAEIMSCMAGDGVL